MDTITQPADRYVSGGSRHAQWSLDAEWRELREPLRRIVLRAELAISGPLDDLPRPLYAKEQEAQRAAIAAFAEQIAGNLTGLLDAILAPLHRRADEAGIDPTTYTVDRSDFDAAVFKITGGE